MYVRKTVDVWEIQGWYGSQYGWETLTTEETRKDAKKQLKCYDDNEPSVPHMVVKKREKIPEKEVCK